MHSNRPVCCAARDLTPAVPHVPALQHRSPYFAPEAGQLARRLEALHLLSSAAILQLSDTPL